MQCTTVELAMALRQILYPFTLWSDSHSRSRRPCDRNGTDARAIAESGEQFVRIRSRRLSNTFSACSRRDSSLKTLLRNNWGRPFEHENTDPKHQYGSIRLAPSQKEHKGRHNSWPKASKGRQRWRRYDGQVQIHGRPRIKLSRPI